MSKADDITMQVKMNNKCFPDIEKLARGQHADEQQILDIVHFVNARYDCADFRMICILRSLYDFAPLISEPTVKTMRECVLNFKYWMDEPGEDSMCYWSENHQLIFAVCEYLAGQLYPQETFTNDGMTGIRHKEKARIKIERWLMRRFQYGFIEWHSNTYYEEDVAPLSLLIDCCRDEGLVLRAKIILDLLLLDMALHSFDGAFCASSGRCYEAQKQSPEKQDVLDIMEKAFGLGRIRQYDYTRLSADFILNRRYDMPQVLREIAHCKQPQLICDSLGLELAEVRKKFPKGCDIEDDGCFLWAMEAFTNAESVQSTITLFNRYHLRTNTFLKDLQMINIPVLHKLHLLPGLVRLLNPVTQGVAIQRANTCTYKTAYSMLSTAQAYHPQEFGDQQHIWQATLPDNITVFTTHPGAAFFEDNARNFSPSYWVGNGVNPHSAQAGNVSLSLYNVNVRKGFLEKQRPQFTHAWVPFSRFDAVHFTNGSTVLCARKGDSYLALLSALPMITGQENELVQKGKQAHLWYHSYWIKAHRPHPRHNIFWGRGNGWVMTALPMILDQIGTQHPEAPHIIRLLCQTADALLPYQQADGTFTTVIGKRSYRELSATALIAAGLLHGARCGWLQGERYRTAGEKAFCAVANSIVQTKQDEWYLPEISAPTIPLHLFACTCYRLTPKGKNWSYGVAAAVFAALEYEKLQ